MSNDDISSKPRHGDLMVSRDHLIIELHNVLDSMSDNWITVEDRELLAYLSGHTIIRENSGKYDGRPILRDIIVDARSDS